jgi:hypothetical protein
MQLTTHPHAGLFDTAHPQTGNAFTIADTMQPVKSNQ